MSQVDRKWDGIPHAEQKRLPPLEDIPLKYGPRRKNKVPNPVVKLCSLYFDSPKEFSTIYSNFYSKTYSPHVGVEMGVYNLFSGAEFTLRRMKGHILKDSLGYYYIINQVGEQISPEFSAYEGIESWLLYEGLVKGWLFVITRHWDGKPHYYIQRKDSY